MPEDTTQPQEQPTFPYMQYGLMPDTGVAVQLILAQGAVLTLSIDSNGMDAITEKRREIKTQLEAAQAPVAPAPEPTPISKKKRKG